MCSPSVIASLALTAAGTGATVAGQKQAQSASNRALDAESIRQRKHDANAQEAFANVLGKLGAGSQTENLANSSQEKQARVESSISAAEPAGIISAVNNDAPSVIQNEVNAAASKGSRVGTLLSKRKMNVDASQDQSLQAGIDLAGGARDASRIAGFKAGSAGVLPLELMDARNKGGSLRTIGDLLNAAGMLTGMGSLASAAGNAGKAGANASRLAALKAQAAANAGRGAGFIAPISSGASLSQALPPIF